VDSLPDRSSEPNLADLTGVSAEGISTGMSPPTDSSLGTNSTTDIGEIGNADPDPDPAPVAGSAAGRSALGKWLAIYTLLRVAILLGLTGLLSLLMPLVLALLFGVILALPLAWVLCGGVRRRVDEAMTIARAGPRAERERLRQALNGDDRR